jgi:pilus assembly protein Flp/PilA
LQSGQGSTDVSSPVPTEPAKGAPRRAILARFVSDCSGATAIEYGLIAGLIALAVTPAIKTAMTNLWGKVLNGISSP